VVRLLETFELVRVLATGGVLTAAVVQTGRIILAIVVQIGQYFRERQQGRDRIKEIEAERDAEIAKIDAAGKVEIAKLQVELQLERERQRALTSSQLSIGPPPPG
jgi:hypothetical protein